MTNVVVSWSGGKDSTFACYKAMQLGYNVCYLANTISEDYKRVRFHGVTARLIQTQAAALCIPLLQKETSAEQYEKEFKANISSVLTPNVTGIIFGDIHLQHCLQWAQNVASDLGVTVIEPLWGQKPLDLLSGFIAAGFQAIVVSTQANLLDKEWVGRTIDKQFLNDIKRLPHIDPCGENGEYHSFVFDGPLFKKRIAITKTEKILRNKYLFLDIQEYKLVRKS